MPSCLTRNPVSCLCYLLRAVWFPQIYAGALNPGDARGPPAAEVLVSTDVCLRALEGRFRSMALPLLINYDLPVRRVRE